MNKKIFLTFSNTTFMGTNRISNEALQFNMFDEIIQLNETHINEFINKHNHFINTHSHGYGYYIWKPKIILDTLLKMNNNDILIYCDAGISLNINGIEKLKYYFDKLNDKDIIAFSTNDYYKSKQYIKMDAIMNYYPEFNNLNQNDTMIYAGLIILKKTETVINLIKDWLNLCENYNLLDCNNSINYNEAPYFCGNDKDNGLYNLCLYKYNNFYRIYPDETNLYHNNGQQLHHTTSDILLFNWDILNDKPFHYTRLTPRHYPTINKNIFK
jgi:hypothetical protein